jgi:hypothetical protein
VEALVVQPEELAMVRLHRSQIRCDQLLPIEERRAQS